MLVLKNDTQKRTSLGGSDYFSPRFFCAGFPGGSVVKNPPANAGDAASVPGWGRSPGEGNGTHSSILAWKTPWTEEPAGYS